MTRHTPENDEKLPTWNALPQDPFWRHALMEIGYWLSWVAPHQLAAWVFNLGYLGSRAEIEAAERGLVAPESASAKPYQSRYEAARWN